jgi:hypothetical protein
LVQSARLRLADISISGTTRFAMGFAVSGNQLDRAPEVIAVRVDEHPGRTGVCEFLDPFEDVIRSRGYRGALAPFDLDVEPASVASCGCSELVNVLDPSGEVIRRPQGRSPRGLRHLGSDEQWRPPVARAGLLVGVQPFHCHQSRLWVRAQAAAAAGSGRTR